MKEHAAWKGEIRKKFKIPTGKFEDERPLERPRYRCQDVDWIQLVQDLSNCDKLAASILAENLLTS
jgi:hypothetical protein